MATIAEQLKSAAITDTLKYESTTKAEEAAWKKLVWAASIITFNASGGHPPGYTKHEPDGSNGGAWLSNKKQTGGNSFVYLVSPSFGTSQASGEPEFRQRSIWLFTTGESTANGYQLCCKDTTSGTSNKYKLRIARFTGGVMTFMNELEVEIEANGGFALAKANGEVQAYVRKTEVSVWAPVGVAQADATFKEGFSGIDGNGSNPTLVNFATGALTVGTPPTAVTEAATEVKRDNVKVSGTSNPKSSATNVWFEYGTTTSYGFKTAVIPIGSGAVGIKSSVKIEGLKPGTLYHFRLVAESASGRTNGSDLTFTTTGTKIRRRRKPSLALDVEIETPDGTYRLPAGAKNPKNKPRNITFGTQRGEGFAIATVTLSREIFKDYPDLNLLDTWRFINESGDIIYEGRLQSMPQGNDPEEEITINLIGWMSYLRSKKISPLIVDSRLSSWSGPSVQRRINLINVSRPNQQEASVVWSSGGAALHFEVQNGWSSPSLPICEAWFNAGNEDIAAVYGDWINGWSDAGFELFVGFSQDDQVGVYEISGDYYGATSGHIAQGSVNPVGKKYAFIEWHYSVTPSGGEGGQYPVDLINLKVVGTHGLTARGSGAELGYGLSDIMKYIVKTYYPKITWAGAENTFTVQQASWHDDGQYGYDILKQLNNLALWELNMWEKRTLYFERADLGKIDWQFKTTDEGVKTNFEGDSIENLANGCSVHYTGFDGVSHDLYPTNHPELRDENDDNPYNKHGEDGWTDCDVPYECDEQEALQFGRVYLEEFNRPKRPGSYTLTAGHIKDAAGHWHAGFDVRNGETCGIMDKIDDEPRLITATNWTDDGKALTITVDAPDKLLDAIVARQELARQARNV